MFLTKLFRFCHQQKKVIVYSKAFKYLRHKKVFLLMKIQKQGFQTCKALKSHTNIKSSFKKNSE